MTKFNSKFNSQTGNFEITANFIGYTYAMLSDMLLGILKANAYTEKGETKYNDLKNTTQPNLLNLNELMIKIAKIDSDTNRLAANDPDSALIAANETKLSELDGIENNIIILGQGIDYKSVSSYDYIIIDEANYSDGEVTTFEDSVEGHANAFNSSGGNPQITDVNKMKNISGAIYENLTLDSLNVNNDIMSLPTEQQNALKTIRVGASGASPTLDEKRAEIFSVASNRGIGSPTTKFRVVDLKYKHYLIDDLRSKVVKDNENAKQRLAVTLKKTITSTLGFEPTIRNIVNTFTTAVEIYLSVMFDVSSKAEASAIRKTELAKAFTSDGNSDLKRNVTDKFYPWPDYRENTATDGYKEKYLGSDGVLNNNNNVDELVYIDDLYKGFIEAKQISDAALLDIKNEYTTWIPVNPFDTLNYIKESPYARIEGNSKEEVLLLLTLRAMTFLGYTNSDEILSVSSNVTLMGEIEARSILKDIKNQNVKDSLSVATLAQIVDIKGNTIDPTNPFTSTMGNVIIDTGNDYTYDYMIKGKNEKFIFLQPPYQIPKGGNMVNFLLEAENNDSICLINYDGEPPATPKNTIFPKLLEIIPIENYEPQTTTVTLIEPETTTNSSNNELSLAKLDTNDIANAGFNVFGGIYGIQEFKNMLWTDTLLNANTTLGTSALPLKYVFIKDFVGLKGFGQSRKKAGADYGLSTATDSHYDHNPDPMIKNYIPLDVQYARISKSSIPTVPSSIRQMHGVNFGKNRYLCKGVEVNYSEVTYPYVEYNILDKTTDSAFSLFGSKFYYLQNLSLCLFQNYSFVDCTNYSKAYLFLNSLPWNGLEIPSVKHLFDVAGGFVHAPRLWCAWIGGLLWRYDESDPTVRGGEIVGGGSGKADPITWYEDISSYHSTANTPESTTFNYLIEFPDKKDFFSYLDDKSPFSPSPYNKLDSKLTNLPDSVTNEFKKCFFDFVNGYGQFNVSWGTLKESLEIWEGDTKQDYFDFLDFFYDIVGTQTVSPGYFYDPKISAPTNSYLPLTYFNKLKFRKTAWDNYNIIAPFNRDTAGSYFYSSFLFLEIKDYSDARNAIINGFRDEVVIANSGYFIWRDDNNTLDNYRPIKVSKDKFNTYMNAALKVLEAGASTAYKQEQDAAQEIFGSTDKNVIKHQLYKTCKNVYDKWIGGATDGDSVVFQCGNSVDLLKNKLDKKIAGVKRPGDKERLIDSFRFVTRSFKDVGDDFYIDTRPVYTYLHDNPNSSFYGCVSDLLASNNFDFIALPSFINYNEPAVMESLFETYSYQEPLLSGEHGSCGPSFVCVYVGQKSKHLDFNGSEYDNDGFDIQCDKNGNMNKNIPLDFATKNEDYENNVAVFKVGYSQQNQNIFKDIILDQSEFTETEESLKIIDDISKTGSENQRHFGGQNLYSVYGVRSYKAEVEMMGNAMIQPMMYFQLDNIPMFHGAYMITQVKHSIRPNYMSTNFTGVRIRHPETPLIKSSELYMSLLDGIGYGSGSGSGNATGNFSYSSRMYGPGGSNNPGNIRCTTQYKGSTGCAYAKGISKPFSQYSDILFGMQASMQALKSIVGNVFKNADGFTKERDTLLTFLMVYAPPNENDVNKYVQQVGDKIKKTVTTFKYNVLTDVDSTLTTNPIGDGWVVNGKPNGPKYVKLKSLKNSTALLPNNAGTGGTNLGDVKIKYENSNGTDNDSYVLLSELMAAKLHKESGAGSLIKVITKEQFWVLWSNKYIGDKSVLPNWGSTDGNKELTKLLTTKQSVTPWSNQLPAALQYKL
jgi:hypothetical protein